MLTSLFPDVQQSIKKEALKHMPEECGGFVIHKHGQYILKPVKNISPRPRFEIIVSQVEIGRIIREENIIAFYHSHPNFDAEFSDKDVEIMLKLLPYPWILYCVALDCFNLMTPHAPGFE